MEAWLDQHPHALDVAGNDYACAWWSGVEQINVQFRDPDLCRLFKAAARMGKFTITRYAVGVRGGYMEIFIVNGKKLNWFKRWHKRNTTQKN